MVRHTTSLDSYASYIEKPRYLSSEEGAVKPIYLFALMMFGTNVMAQTPVKEILAYSRDTTPGIPARPNTASVAQTPIKTDYYIYVVIKKTLPVSSVAACVRGKPYAATLQKVDPPVLVEHDVTLPTGIKDTLVKPTPDDVYQVLLGQEQSPDCKTRDLEKLAQTHPVVISLKSGQSTWYASADKIIPLRPAAGM